VRLVAGTDQSIHLAIEVACDFIDAFVAELAEQ